MLQEQSCHVIEVIAMTSITVVDYAALHDATNRKISFNSVAIDEQDLTGKKLLPL